MIYGTFSGTINSGSDVGNLFGQGAGADLSGQTITGTFTFDPAAFLQTVVNSGKHLVYAYGGPVFGDPIMSPPGTVTETINGHSVTWVGIGSSSLSVFQNTPAYVDGSVQDTTALGVGVSDITNKYGTAVDFGKTNSTTTIISPNLDLSTLGFSDINGDPIEGGGFGGEIFLGDGGVGPIILFSVTSESVVSASPTLSVSIEGTAPEASVLTAAVSDGTASSYQWQELVGGIWRSIAGATGQTYLVQEADEGSQLEVMVATTDESGATITATSLATSAVTDVAPTLTLPVISGVAQKGDTVSATAAVPNDSDATVAYQWQESFDGGSSWNNIGSATGQTYVLQQSDEGAMLRIIATSSDSDGSGTSATSAPTATVIGARIRWARAISGDFDTAARWVGGQVPSRFDNPVLNGTATYAVTLSTDHTINNLRIKSASATLSIANAVALAIDGAHSSNAGTLAIGASGAATVVIANGAHLAGGGLVDLGSSTAAIVSGGATEAFVNVSDTIKGAGTVGDANMSLTNKSVIEATGQLTLATGPNAILNTGTIEALGAGARLTVGSALENAFTGQLVAAGGGEIDVLSSAEGGSATISGSGSILELAGSTSARTSTGVSFEGGAAGLLELDNSAMFKSTVAGFAGGDSIDVLDIGFDAKRDSYDPTTGMLKVTDGVHTAKIQLLGSYVSSQFVFQSDLHGGTLITDPPPPASAMLASHA
jgi:hypothetical protein